MNQIGYFWTNTLSVNINKYWYKLELLFQSAAFIKAGKEPSYENITLRWKSIDNRIIVSVSHSLQNSWFDYFLVDSKNTARIWLKTLKTFYSVYLIVITSSSGHSNWAYNTDWFNKNHETLTFLRPLPLGSSVHPTCKNISMEQNIIVFSMLLFL